MTSFSWFTHVTFSGLNPQRVSNIRWVLSQKMGQTEGRRNNKEPMSLNMTLSCRVSSHVTTTWKHCGNWDLLHLLLCLTVRRFQPPTHFSFIALCLLLCVSWSHFHMNWVLTSSLNKTRPPASQRPGAGSAPALKGCWTWSVTVVVFRTSAVNN